MTRRNRSRVASQTRSTRTLEAVTPPAYRPGAWRRFARSAQLDAFAVVCHKRHGSSEFQARAACVAEIVRQLQRRAVGRLVIESRQDDRDDVRTITRIRAKEPALVFEHRAARHERALWLADAVSWAVGAGSTWTDLLGGSLIEVIEIDPG